jgi:hypothetical protein
LTKVFKSSSNVFLNLWRAFWICLFLQNAKSATVVKLTVVPCPPVVEVKIKRPDTKYQLGFSVQNGVVSCLSYLMSPELSF